MCNYYDHLFSIDFDFYSIDKPFFYQFYRKVNKNTTLTKQRPSKIINRQLHDFFFGLS